MEGIEPAGDDHHGGGLRFGPDGKLYWSTGDNVCCSVLDGRNSQDLTNMYGKVLRLNPDGTAPADNPFYDGAGPNYDAIYATGFRNPFRLAFTPDGKLLVVDVGQATWEEVNLVTAGANYGWPNAEGPCNGIGTPSCATPSSYANPIYAYRHTRRRQFDHGCDGLYRRDLRQWPKHRLHSGFQSGLGQGIDVQF